MGATIVCVMLGHSAITYLVEWKGVQASEQLFCGLVGKKTWQEVINPFPRFFLHTQALNDQKMGCPFGHNISKFFRGLPLAVKAQCTYQTPPQSADCVWQLIN